MIYLLLIVGSLMGERLWSCSANERRRMGQKVGNLFVVISKLINTLITMAKNAGASRANFAG